MTKTTNRAVKLTAALTTLLLALAIGVLAPASAHAHNLEAAEVREQADGGVKATPMHRLYNPNSGEHFYTASTSEKDFLAKIGWRYEGVGWYAPNSGGNVYRLYNPNSGDHHYTTSASEKDYLARIGWRYEGVGWHSGGNVALYRQYNPNAWVGTHNYTTSKSEHDFLVGIGWRGEGVAWKGVDHAHAWQPVTKNVTTTEKYEVTVVYPSAHDAAAQAAWNTEYSTPYLEFENDSDALAFVDGWYSRHPSCNLGEGVASKSRAVTKTVTTGYTCSGCGITK